MKIMHCIKIGIILIIFTFVQFTLAADNTKNAQPTTASSNPAAIGQIVWVKGIVKAIAPGQTARTLQRRSPIFTQDTVTTDNTSTAEIVFSDNSLLTLRADSTIKIDQYQFGKNVAPEKSTFVASVVKGGFRTITGIIPKNNAQNYKVNTPVATIAVEGTAYAVYYKGQLYVKYFSGRPCIKNSAGTLCLDPKAEYAKVTSSETVPEQVTAAPGIFDAQPEITSGTFNPAASVSPGGAMGGPGSQSGNGPKKAGGGFCIVQ